jgi:hypothetical protein|nr:hypothetical protein [Kofleriaceae bacterium]
MRAIAIVSLAIACGGGHGTTPHDAAPIDAPADAPPLTNTVTGNIVEIESQNDGSGNPVSIVGHPDPSAITLAVRRVDGSTADVAYGNDGTFTFQLAQPGDAYRLTLTITGQSPKEFDSSAPHVQLGLLGAGRIPRTAPKAAVQIQASFDNWVVGDTAFLQTTGLWTATSQEIETSPAPPATEPWGFTWEWDDAVSLSGGIGLLDGSAGDIFAITDWHPTGSGAGAYESIVGALVHDDVTMHDGDLLHFGVTNVPIDMPAIPARCAHVVAPRATEMARVAAALPDVYNSATDEWDLLVPAGSGLAATGAMPLATASEREGTLALSAAEWRRGSIERVPPAGSATDANLTVSFGDPFAGDQLIVEDIAHELREIHADPGSDDFGVFVNEGTQTFAEVDLPVDCTGTAVLAQVAPAVAIVAQPSANGAALDHDGAVVAADAGSDVTVAWTNASDGVADEYAVELITLTDVNDQATLGVVLTVFATDPQVAFDASLFQPGQQYLIEVFARQGFPNAADGDFATETFPFANGVTMSHAFTVAVSAGSGSATRSPPARP